ncbi:hypothetical protein FRC11_004509, partial [Ceratobasidium sp. 423]
ARGCSIPNPGDPIPTYRGPTNVIRPSLLHRRGIPPYAKLVLYSHLRRLRLPGPESRRPLAQVPAPPPTPQPPDGNNSDLPSHQDIPQSSRLYKSLYGLPQCLRSQADISASSLNSGDASNTPVFSQAGSNSNSASDSDTTGTANDSVNNLEQNSSSDVHETANELGLANLDPRSIFELGLYYCNLALQLDTNVASVGMSQDNIPDSVSTAPAHHPPISGSQIQHPHFSSSGDTGPSEQPSAGTNASQPETDMTHIGAFYGGESSFVHPNGHERAFPRDIVPRQPATSPPGYNGVNNAVTPSSSSNDNIGQYPHNFHATGPDPQLSPPGEVNQIPGLNPRVCHWQGCRQEFSRTSLLLGHMYQHDRIKRE